MRKAVDDFATLNFLGRGQGFRHRDHGGEILLAVHIRHDMRAAGEPRRAGGEDTRANLLTLGRYDAVGCKQNRPVEGLKLG